MSDVHKWYNQRITIFRNMYDEALREKQAAERLLQIANNRYVRQVALEALANAADVVCTSEYMIEFLKDMYDREEEYAEKEAWMENYPVPPDYDPHPCASQKKEDNEIWQGHMCAAYTCGVCGSTHLYIVDPDFYQ